jgi:hypothetical protein
MASSRGFSGQNLSFQGTVPGSAESTLIRGLNGKSIALGMYTGADFGTDVIYVGYRAGNGNAGGANTIAIGNNCAADVSGAIFESVLVGQDVARYAMPTADSNVALGNHTLNFLSTGHQNTALGDSAMANAADGSLNAAVGAQALFQCGSGSGNVALGGLAGQYQDGIVNSVLVGYQAGNGGSASNQGGEWNVGVGARAGFNMTGTSRFNSLVGGECGFHTTSSSNSAVGFRALYEQSPTSSGGFVAVGLEAARGASGSNTIALGNHAGKGSSGNSCILIGNRAGQSNAQDFLFQVGMAPKEPLVEGNLDTSNAPHLTARGAIKVKQKSLNVADLAEDGVVLIHDTGQNGKVVWQMVVLDDGSCMLRQNGNPICVFEP